MRLLCEAAAGPGGLLVSLTGAGVMNKDIEEMNERVNECMSEAVNECRKAAATRQHGRGDDSGDSPNECRSTGSM